MLQGRDAHAQRRGRAHAAPMPSPLPAASGFARTLLARCARGDAVACRQSGEHLARGEGGVAADGAAAARLLERAWTLNRDEGCEWFYHLRSELPPNAVQRACDHGCGFACETRAWQRVAADPGVGAGELERLCDRGGAHACYTLGHALLDGVLLPRDRRGALEHIARACDLGGATACYELSVEQWTAELQRAREAELDPARRLAIAPLRLLRRAALRAPGASPPWRPTPGAPRPRTGERSDGDLPRERSAPTGASRRR